METRLGSRGWWKSLTLLILAMALPLPAIAQVFTVTPSGNNIIVTVGYGLSGNQCCRGSGLDLLNPSGAGAFCSQPCGAPVTDTYTCNWVGTHVVTACWADDHTNGYVCAQQNVAVTVPPGPSCSPQPSEIKFNIIDNNAKDERRVLLSNSHLSPGGVPDYPYPFFQNFLAQDKKIPMDMRILINSVATPAIPVTLQVIDPADPSEYVVGVPGQQPGPGSHVNDNVDTTLPTISGTGVTANGTNNYSVMSGANGYIETVLTLDAGAKAGDNYQVVATATLPDGTTKTQKSGVVTAWKRLFLEKKQMFRHGSPLATNAPAGIDRIIVPNAPIDPAGTRYAKHDYLLLLHAPAYGQPKTAGSYYSGLYRINTNPTNFTAAAQAPGAGTVATNGTTAIVGTSTHFNKLNPGDVVNIPGASGQAEARIVITVTNNTHMTVDTPTTSAAANLTYTIGDANLIPGTSYTRLRLDRALTESYQREPLSPIGDLTLNDSVAKLAAGGITSADYFDSTDSLLTGGASSQWSNAFPSAYTEYIVLPPQPTPTPLPHVLLPNNDPVAQWFVNKWFALPQPAPFTSTNSNPFLTFFYTTPANHQTLLVGDAPSNAQDAGQTFLSVIPVATPPAPHNRTSILDRGLVERDAVNPMKALNLLDPNAIMQKVEVHELAHQWDVNPSGAGGHCQTVGYNSTAPYPQQQNPPAPTPAGVFFCTMAFDNTLTMPAPWNSSILVSQTIRQYGNGTTTFHMIPLGNGQWDSEYFTIRNAADPWLP